MDTAEGMQYEPKCRWIIIGFHDPDVLSLERTSPTPLSVTVNVMLSASVGLEQDVYQGDISTAFLQGRRISRELYCEQPKEGIPGLEPGQLLQLEREVYGTTRAPAAWREALVSAIEELGYEKSILDPCLFILRSEGSQRTATSQSKTAEAELQGLQRMFFLLEEIDPRTTQCRSSSRRPKADW